jgi:ubiquinone/menaquinone biosynthesis C-methylase UbiE
MPATSITISIFPRVMPANDLVRKQFNLQATSFDSWNTPKNLEYLKGFSLFCGLTPEDTLLDVACGTGDFTAFAAPSVKKAMGIDISDRMIDLSRERAKKNGIYNCTFKLGDVERLPFPDYSFSIVACKSAFHHMPHYQSVFSEMARCCEPGGRIALCDIAAYEDPAIDAFFEQFEKLVDASHAQTLLKREFARLYKENRLAILRTFELEIEHSIAEYLSHAVQSKDDLKKLAQLLEKMRKIPGMRNFWNTLDGNFETMKFKKTVFLVLGTRT